MGLVPPDPPLARGGVRLRLLRDDDAGWITSACNDPKTARFVVDLPLPYTEADARAFLASGRHRWASGTSALFVIAADGAEPEGAEGEPLGIVELHLHRRDPGVASVGYWLRPEGRGRGAATLAVGLVAGWAFEELGVERLELTTAPDNADSQGVATRAGFTREGVLRAWMATTSGRRDSVMFSLLKDDPRPPAGSPRRREPG